MQMALPPVVDFVIVAGRDELDGVYVKGMDTAMAGPISDADDWTVVLPSTVNPELALVSWPCKVVVFTDDGSLFD